MSIIVSIVFGGSLVLLMIVLLIALVICRRRKHIRSTSHRRRLPTFADITMTSEVASFLPAAGAANGVLGLDFGGCPTSSVGEVCRRATSETVDMPPSYDSVVKDCSDDVAAVCRRRRSGASSGRRSQARLSLPPLSTTALPPVLRTHRRAESDAEEHIYEDPASLRRSLSRDAVGSWSAGDNSGFPAESCREVLPPNSAPSSSEVANRSPSEAFPPCSDDVVYPGNLSSDLLESLPCGISSAPLPICSSQPRFPRVRLGTSALYCRPDSRTIDWCRSAGDFPAAAANRLQPFSPLSAIGYSEVVDSPAHPYRPPGNEFLSVRSPCTPWYSASVGWQPPPVSGHHRSPVYDDILESPQQTDHSTAPGNHYACLPDAVPYLEDELSLIDDQYYNTSSARSSSAESEHSSMDHVSPLFDDGSIVI